MKAVATYFVVIYMQPYRLTDPIRIYVITFTTKKHRQGVKRMWEPMCQCPSHYLMIFAHSNTHLALKFD